MSFRNRFSCVAVLCAVAALSWVGKTTGEDAPKGGRMAWTGSKVIGSPEPPHPYVLERVFPNVTIKDALEIVFQPRSDRVWVAQQYGKVYSFPNDNSVKEAELAIDLQKEFASLVPHPQAKQVAAVYGMEFHPDFGEKNRYVYVCYVLDSKDGKPLADGSRVSRFTVSETTPPRIEAKSEVLLLTFLAHGHNGGCLKFGPDRMLYISTGDAASPAPPDPLNTGQDNSDFLAAILRIDVEKKDEGKNYAVPKDNPFVNTPGCLPEIYCYGFRNPWRMSFDRATGELWIGDVGWELWELVYRGFSGANFGWSVMEGPQPVRPNDKVGPTPITPPSLALPHSESASITGGYVYRGKRLPELVGHYVFGDWETRRIWSSKVNGQKLEPHREIALTDIRVVSFGEDAAGEIYVLAYEGTVHRLAPNPNANSSSNFPRKLSETGLFSSVKEQRPAEGVYGFEVNTPQWVDGAAGKRFIGIPGEGTVVHGQERRTWPKGTVLVRTFSLGEGSSARNVETQLLHFDGVQWKAYAYAWNEEGSDAELVEANGAERIYVVEGKERAWRFHSRAQCLTCHNPWADYALGFTREQLDRAGREGEKSAGSPLQMAIDLKLYDPRSFEQRTKKDAKAPPAPPAMVDAYDASANLDRRARSYLHVNCSHCHRFGAGGTALIDLRQEIPLKEMKVVDQPPMQGAFGLEDPKIVAAGEPARSVLFYRFAKMGPGRMPHIGSEEVDERGVNLLREWITSLSPSIADRKLQIANPPDIDAALATPSSAVALLNAIDRSELSKELRSEAIARASSNPNPQVRDLFERFTPVEQRVKRLGTNFDAKELLAMKGDAERGREVFFNVSGGLCSQCHVMEKRGTEFGPDLSEVGKKYGRAELLEQILHPSKTVEPQWVTYVVKTKDEAHVGFVVSRTDSEIVVKDAQRHVHRIATSDVRRMTAQSVSAMPEHLLSGLTSQQAADLLEYLVSRK